MYSKTFLKPDGNYEAVISSAPVHYLEQGAWNEINTNFVSTSNGFQNKTNVIQSYFPASTGLDKIKLVVNGTNEIFISSEKKLGFMNENFYSFPGFTLSENTDTKVLANSIQYSYGNFSCTDEFTVLNGQVKNNLVFHQFPYALYPKSGYFGVEELIELPAGWKITAADNSNLALTSSALFILDANGNHVLTIPAPVVYDKNGLNSDGTSPVQAKYRVRESESGYFINTLVPLEWFNDENTQFPVTIDPTIVIAGNTGGWQSPNNWVDSPAFVFLGVCCSNLTHRAWIKFSTTSIPDTECVLSVELQVNVATVVAATPELVHVNSITGAFGPYGGIVPAAYTDMGDGYYTSFTINGTGTYGYYTLGALANAVMQSQLAVNWFQVGMMFDNEPSTNYKIINGTSSNLRVTYNTCVLPVELLTFDASCNNHEVTINWTTASQINNQFFTVERTVDGITYEEVGRVNNAGNSNQTHAYSFTDKEPLEGTAYYVLKQTDMSGHTTELKSTAITCESDAVFKVYPNPSTGKFSIEEAEQNSAVVVTDVLGQIVYQTRVNGEKTEVDVSNQLNGIYFVQVISKSGLSSEKIIVSK